MSLFIDPDAAQVEAAAGLGAEMIELHAGAFANAAGDGAAFEREVERLIEGAKTGHAAGLQVNAGHGINTANMSDLCRVPHLVELNIGHHIVSRSVMIGLGEAVKEMRAAMDAYPK